jgi:hypothetical protein
MPLGEAAQYPTSFLLTESDDGTRLGVRVVFDGQRFRAGTARAVGERLRRVLAWMAEQGGVTVDAIDILSARSPRRRLHIGLKPE